MSSNLLTVLKAEYSFLSRVERKIADRLLADPDAVKTLSLAQMADSIGVSQGSIINFCRKFTGGGYPALKEQLFLSKEKSNDLPFSVINNKISVKSAMELKIRDNLAAFQNTLALNSDESLTRAVDKILSARKIEIYGIFNSGIVARSFCYQLIQLGIPAAFVSDTLMCAVSASMLTADSLVIAISESGRTKEILDAVEIVKRNGVAVICLTANSNSPLARLSDDVLLCASSGMTVSDRSEEVRLSQYLITDTLCSYLRSIIDQGGNTHYFKLRSILNSHNVNE